MSDKQYVYGAHDGQTYRPIEGDDTSGEERTHHDPRVEVSAPGHGIVQVGVVPPTSDGPDTAVWDPEEGQFLSLDRDGVNRLIRALREARESVYGRDE